jgi:hypothetical protein
LGFLPLFLLACGAEKSPSSSVETKRGALGETISTDQASYALGATITVTYAGMPGNAHDWIGLAPANSPNTTYVDYVFTNGQTSGTATFTVATPGAYVVRGYQFNTYNILAESTFFSVGGPTISTDKSAYFPGATITMTFSGLPGNAP